MNSPTFKEVSDGRMVTLVVLLDVLAEYQHVALSIAQMTATFETPGVQKQDMHVSFRSKHIIVTWRMQNVREKIEDGVLVRERQEVKHT